MISYIIGNKGNGKSLMLTEFLYLWGRLGYKIFSSYSLSFPHIFISDFSTLEELEEEKAVFGMDEAYLSGMDARRSQSVANIIMSNHMAQSRKNRRDFFLVMQREGRLDVNIRSIVDFLIEPTIESRVGESDTDKPTMIRIDVTDYQTGAYLGFAFIPVQYGNVDFCDKYDTHEIMKNFSAPQKTFRQKIFKKYWESRSKTISDLSDEILWEEDDIKKSEAMTIAKRILYYKKRNEVPEWMN